MSCHYPSGCGDLCELSDSLQDHGNTMIHKDKPTPHSQGIERGLRPLMQTKCIFINTSKCGRDGLLRVMTPQPIESVLLGDCTMPCENTPRYQTMENVIIGSRSAPCILLGVNGAQTIILLILNHPTHAMA